MFSLGACDDNVFVLSLAAAGGVSAAGRFSFAPMLRMRLVSPPVLARGDGGGRWRVYGTAAVSVPGRDGVWLVRHALLAEFT